jgi:glycosyltransferase involved in cell wall biosynthesis
MSLVSILIPFYNESDTINYLIDEINLYSQNCKIDFEIIFIDDGSIDGTSDKIKNKNIQFKCKLLILSKNFGSHSAIKAGFFHSQGEYAVYLPADLQISFDSIEKLYSSILDDCDITVGVRKENEINMLEKLFSRFYAVMMRKFAVPNFPNAGIETLMINRKVINLLNSNIEGNSSFVLQILSFGFKSRFVFIDKKSRNIGKSKWTLSKKIKLFIDSFVAFSYAPIRFVTIIGFALFFIGVVFSFYLISRKLMYNDLVSGWTMLISILAIGFGITNISLGIIAEYLWRTFDSSRKRPVFIIDDIIDLKN